MIVKYIDKLPEEVLVKVYQNEILIFCNHANAEQVTESKLFVNYIGEIDDYEVTFTYCNDCEKDLDNE